MKATCLPLCLAPLILLAFSTYGQSVTVVPSPAEIAPLGATYSGTGQQAALPAATSVTFQEASEVLSDPFDGARVSATLQAVRPDQLAVTRGAKEAQLYRRVSPSVVLVVTKNSLGSGSLLNSQGDVLTNWHVVMGADQVGVVFKPSTEGKTPSKADFRRARVLKVDEVADLALLHVDEIPAGIEPLALGSMSDISVGDDVHAIGHPTGEAWTYTKGVVSQVREGYQWTSDQTRKAHHADVIQTQTPINPGNSGGPLLSDQGKLIGVNSFKSQGEGLNFAVAVDEVQRFIAQAGGRVAMNAPNRAAAAAASPTNCKAKILYQGPNTKRDGDVIVYDLDCDGKADSEIRIPYDKKLPIITVFDRKKSGKIDLMVFDGDRDGKWDLSVQGLSPNGDWELIGLHPDGKLVASRFLTYTEATLSRVAADPATYRH